MPMQVRSNAERARFNWRSGAAASAIKRSGLFVPKRLRAISAYWLEIRFKHWMRQIVTFG
jgi:hypothetical protein